MDYSVNISKNGKFYLEINRLSDQCKNDLVGFMAITRLRYPISDGFKCDLYKKSCTKRKIDI